MFTEREINRTKRKCIIADNCTFQVEKVSVSVPEWMLGIFAALEKDEKNKKKKQDINKNSRKISLDIIALALI